MSWSFVENIGLLSYLDLQNVHFILKYEKVTFMNINTDLIRKVFKVKVIMMDTFSTIPIFAGKLQFYH